MIGIDLLAAHMVGDFILQSHWMAVEKLERWDARLAHVLLYSIPFSFLVTVYEPPLGRGLLFLVLLLVTHFIIDSRRWASGDLWPPRPILVDQAIHLVQLAVLGRLLLP